MNGTLFIISAASGTGKTSLAKALADSTPDVKISISHTTRPIRQKETADLSYFFVGENEFMEMVRQNNFLEYAKVFDYYYGTSRSWVLEQLQNGIDIILDIDWQGARKIQQIMRDKTISIFLLPPSTEELQKRLENRNRDSAEIMKDRMAQASSEISHYNEFDYLIINDDFSKALADLQNILFAQRLKCSRQSIKHADLLAKLLKKG